jgi:hypothetical protein
MRSRLLTVALGVLLTIGVAEGLVRILDERLPTGTVWPSVESQAKFELLHDLPSTEVVFLGSSITEAAVDPVLFAQKATANSAFNSGIPFSTPFSNEWWLDEVVLRELRPHMVVIGLTAWSGGVRPDQDPLLSRYQEARAARGAPPVALLEHAGVLSEWESRMSDARARALLTDLGHQTGYYDRSIDDAKPVELPYGPPEMPGAEAAAVGRMIDRLRAEDIATFVLIEPGRYPGDKGTIDYDRYIDSVLSHHADWGVPVVDTFHLDWERKWFADLAHFNREGTEEFTSYIAGVIDGMWAEDSRQPVGNPADIA